MGLHSKMGKNKIIGICIIICDMAPFVTTLAFAYYVLVEPKQQYMNNEDIPQELVSVQTKSPQCINPYANLADIKVFIMASQLSLFLNSIRRDVLERNYSLQQALEYYQQLRKDYTIYLFPQEAKVDRVLNVEIDPSYAVTITKPISCSASVRHIIDL